LERPAASANAKDARQDIAANQLGGAHTEVVSNFFAGIDVLTCSAKGGVHKFNEDSVLINMGKRLFGVADGISRGKDGATASRVALRSLVDNQEPLTISSALTRFKEAHEDVYALLSGEGGATAIVARIVGGELFVCNVGDCRAYELFPQPNVRGERLQQITSDHVVPSEDQPNATSGSSVKLAQAVGFWVFEVGKNVIRARVGTVVILCTDGLWANSVALSNVTGVLIPKWSDLKTVREQCDAIANEAAKAGDDCSFVAIRFYGKCHIRPSLWASWWVTTIIGLIAFVSNRFI
jgi:serine/threonine protein phosphatase PrpC